MEGEPETQPMMMEEKKEEEKKSEKSKTSSQNSAKTAEHKDNLEPCCCCLCVCSNDKTVNSSCLGCFPIKCGVILIGIFTFVLACILVTYNFFFILNEYVAWYFPIVVLVLLIPLVISVFFFVVFFTKDTISTRGKLGPACQLALISIALAAIWTLCYFIFLYKKDAVYTGAGDPEYQQGYKKTSKKVYVFTILGESIVLVSLYAYFICICETYYSDMKEVKEE